MFWHTVAKSQRDPDRPDPAEDYMSMVAPAMRRRRSEADWKRLGDLLAKRRVDDLGYAKLTSFARTVGLSWRLLWDIENGRRPNYRPATITAVEVAYQLEQGRIGSALLGGELGPVQSAKKDLEPAWEHPHDRAIWSLTDLPEEVRRDLITFAQTKRTLDSRDDSGQGGHVT